MTDLVDAFVVPLEVAGLSYIITGSVAAMVYGEPRLTNDIDLVVELDELSIPALAAAFPEPAYYRPPADLIDTSFISTEAARLGLASLWDPLAKH
jgi:hypothetical protein